MKYLKPTYTIRIYIFLAILLLCMMGDFWEGVTKARRHWVALWDTYECLLDSQSWIMQPLRARRTARVMPNAHCPLTCLLLMEMNGGQRSSVLYQSRTNMPFSRSRRSGPLSRRTPAIGSQHLAKYAPLLGKANSVYNSAFLKPPLPPAVSETDSRRLRLL